MTANPMGVTSPPRPDLAFRVGIVGHRPNRLPKEADKLNALRSMLRMVLNEVQAEVRSHAGLSPEQTQFSDAPAVLRAISPLAEGSDRMFAEQALDLGYALCCPMPFSQEEFEKDFMPPDALEENSVARFQGFLQRARAGAGLTIFELDGDRADKDVYGVAGRVVLNQSDLLIAVWDGHEAAGRGGTVDTLRDAVKYHVPVLWIDALEPASWQMLRTEKDLDCLETGARCTPQRKPVVAGQSAAGQELAGVLTQIVRGEIALPAPESKDHRQPRTQSSAPQYFDEHKPRLNLAVTWKLFRDCVGSARFRRPSFAVGDFVGQIRADWPTRGDAGAAPVTDVEDWVNRRLRVHYAWSDKRGDLYADAYRSAYVLTYLLSAFAVFIALVPMAIGLDDDVEVFFVWGELVTLLLIVVMFMWGGKRHWHERWMEYRLLAELVRQLRFLIPLGGGRPFPHVPIHLAGYGNPTQTWMSWHMRAIARATGIPQVRVTPAYVNDCLDNLAKVVCDPRGGQLAFHENNEKRSENISHRLHIGSLILFGLTIVGIGFHLALSHAETFRALHWLHEVLSQQLREALQRWLVLASATLPAFGAALAGINNQGEFSRIAKRSAGMVDGFKRFRDSIQALRASAAGAAKAPKLSQVIPLARDVADMMVDEVSDWRVVFIDRPQPAA
jgi:hypothetical protein